MEMVRVVAVRSWALEEAAFVAAAEGVLAHGSAHLLAARAHHAWLGPATPTTILGHLAIAHGLHLLLRHGLSVELGTAIRV